MSIAPTLTVLDRKVLLAVPRYRSSRAREVIAKVARLRSLSPREEREVREILRGLEHFGYVAHNNGWWQRTSHGHNLLEGTS